MVLMNYHELTMNERRDSPARRQQFLVICGVMGLAFLYSTITAGLFHPIPVQTNEKFPGGTLVYKSTKRDYAAAGSLETHVAEEFGLNLKETVDTVFSVFLDNPAVLSDGRRTRFASGVLVTKNNNSSSSKAKKEVMAKNDEIQNPTRNEVLELAAQDLWPRLKFKEFKLPSATVNLVHFPFTNGFISSLLLQYRILPALRRSIGDEGAVIFSTCSVPDSMCTHYATVDPAYRLGQPDFVTYKASLPPPRPLLTLEDVDRIFGRTGLGRYLGFGRKNAHLPAGKDEL